MGRARSKQHAVAAPRRGTAGDGAEVWVAPDDGRGGPLVSSGATIREVDDFAGGFCHALAASMADRFGWRLRILGTPVDEYSIRPFSETVGSIRHVYCLNDEGRPVDIHGIFKSEEALRRFFADKYDPDEPLVSEDLPREDLFDRLRSHSFARITEREADITERTLDRLALNELTAR